MTRLVWEIIICFTLVYAVGAYFGYVAGTNSAKRQTEELFLKDSSLSLGEIAMCLDIIYRSEK